MLIDLARGGREARVRSDEFALDRDGGQALMRAT
jgi:hypothetical protein